MRVMGGCVVGLALVLLAPWSFAKTDKSALKFNHGKFHFSIAWSPDAKWFVIGGEEKFEKYDANGKTLGDIRIRKYASGSPAVSVYYDLNEAISPDGNRIAFRASATGDDGVNSSRIWILDTTSGTALAASDGKGDGLFPSWGKDGTLLYYTVKNDKRYAVHAFDTTSGGDKTICPGVDGVKRVVALRDGRLLLATSTSVLLAPAACDSTRALGPKVETADHIVLSPNQKQFALSTIESDLWVVSMDDGSSIKVATNALLGVGWMNDEQLIYSKTISEGDWHPSELRSVKSDGTADTLVSERSKSCTEAYVYGAPNGGAVAFEHHCQNKDEKWVGILTSLGR